MQSFFFLAFLVLMMTAQPMNTGASTTAPASNASTLIPVIKADIQKIERKVDANRSRQDTWNRWNLRFAIAAVVFGGLAWACQRKAAEEERGSRPLYNEFKQKNERLLALQNQDSEYQVGIAQTTALNAQTDVTNAQIALTNTEKELAAQKERTAKAESRLEELRRGLSDRSLSTSQRQSILNSLKGAAPVDVTISHLGNDPEGGRFAEKIGSVLKQAGWKPGYVGNTFYDWGEPTKSHLSVTGDRNTIETASRLAAGLNKAGVPTEFKIDPNTLHRNYIALDIARNQAGADLFRNDR